MESTDIKLLDCTLREAPIDNLLWGDYLINKIIKGLLDTHIDIIEIGFLRDAKYREGSTIFNCTEQIEKYIPESHESQFVAMVDYGRFDVNTLSVNNGKSIDGIRVCFKKEDIESVIDYAKQIQSKGYWVSIQQVDTRGYKDQEILEFVQRVNLLQPEAYSIVDTFGSLYEEDAIYLYNLISNNLNPKISLGFHAHNNLMLAASNTQRFINDLNGKRKIIVDASLHGCGRGAGNSHTELLAEYITRHCHPPKYNLDALLLLIDHIIPELKDKCKWGYSIPYYIAGLYSTHVFNIDFLMSRHRIRSDDLKNIINQLDDTSRRTYNYPFLEKLYVDYFDKKTDDANVYVELEKIICNRTVLVLAPGKSVVRYQNIIMDYINKYNPIIIHLNTIIEHFPRNFVFCASQKRYDEFGMNCNGKRDWIVTSNLRLENNFSGYVVDYKKLIRFGWINIDNVGILALRLLKSIGLKEVFVAGFDGYNYERESNFYSIKMQTEVESYVIDRMNQDIKEMLKDIISDDYKVNFLTPSKYSEGLI